MNESHSETRVLEYPFSTLVCHAKGYLRVLGGGRAAGLVAQHGGAVEAHHKLQVLELARRQAAALPDQRLGVAREVQRLALGGLRAAETGVLKHARSW